MLNLANIQNKTIQPEGNPESPLHALYRQKRQAESELESVEARIARGDASHEAVETVQRLESKIRDLSSTIDRVSPLYTAARQAAEKAVLADQDAFAENVALIAAFALKRYAKIKPAMVDNSDSWLQSKVGSYHRLLFRSLSWDAAKRQAEECLRDPRAIDNDNWSEVVSFPKPPAEVIRYLTPKREDARRARA